MDRRDRETRRSRSRESCRRTGGKRRSRSRSWSRRQRSRSRERRRSRSKERRRSRSRRRSLERRRSRSVEKRRRSKSRERRRSRSRGRYRSRSRDRRSRSWSKTPKRTSPPTKRNRFGSVSPLPRQDDWHVKELKDVRKVHARTNSREESRENRNNGFDDRQREIDRDRRDDKHGSYKWDSKREPDIVEIKSERRSNSSEETFIKRSGSLLKDLRRISSGERPPSPPGLPPPPSPAADVTSYFSQKIETFQEKCGAVQKQVPPTLPSRITGGAPKDPRIQPRHPKQEADLASSSKVMRRL